MTVADVSEWHEDLLGPDFQACDINLGPDPEGEGDIVATLVRYGQPAASKRAVLWVHGMTDYFFHEHVARALDEAGYAFYALDLRKCGRSCQEGQRWHYSEDFRHYFPELTAALDIITAVHPDVTPIAHSTAGMIVPLWAAHLARNDSARHSKLGGIVLNSPFLDMMYPRAAVALGRPLVGVLGRLLPGLEVPGGNLGSYGMSIHRDHHGEWDFDVNFKPLRGHRKYLGWLREVLRTQAKVQRGEINVGVPVLTLCSARSRLGKPYSEESAGVDTVLDTEQIKRCAPLLGDDVTVHPIEGAKHDVFLSRPEPLTEALATTVGWLKRR
ncbi:alpha/beta fold hydrolase [Corynebacterium comes]|uniref:Alpha/beta hydrolase family protein n=1 Tax=Corynebacterium comes TaxID=2675218 RepID=A0A6B8W0M4_9CORY|nr:alpha/beta hydrolase [Corynebacterium comes]QGU04885.1 Alpha/beta hydrolase family protein [Corynebacterium comes]